MVLLKISVDEFFGFALLNAKLLRQAERRKPVHDTEVHRLGAAAVFSVNQHRRHAEDLRRGERMDVITAAKSFHQQSVFRKVRQQAQFNLRIIGGEQYMARLSDNRRANFTAQLGANRNILQVGIDGGKPPGGGPRLVESGVQPLG